MFIRDWEGFINDVKEQLEILGVKRAVIGVSGGVDSTVSCALLVRLIGKDNVFPILLPNGVQSDIQDSYRVCEALGVVPDEVNIGDIYNLYKNTLDLTNEDALINLAPRIRMSVLRAKAQEYGAFLCGTGNLSEYTTGYFTKDGDSCSDFNMIIGLTKTEVVDLGKYLEEIPMDLVIKAPSDGLSGQTDEEKLGIDYWEIDRYIFNNIYRIIYGKGFGSRDNVPLKDELSGCDFLNDSANSKMFSLIEGSEHKRSKYGIKSHTGNIYIPYTLYGIHNYLSDSFSVDRDKSMLLIIDWQNDFVSRAGSLSCANAYNKTFKLIQLMYLFNCSNRVATKDTHEDAIIELAYDGSKLPKHCVRGSWGCNLYGNIDKLICEDNIIEKDSFGSNDLVKHISKTIRDNELDTIYVVGVATDICVRENVLLLQGALPGIKIVLVEDLCVGTTEVKHKEAIEELKEKGIEVV